MDIYTITSPIFEPAISQNFGTIFVFSRRSRYSLSTYESPANRRALQTTTTSEYRRDY